jgi:hypothetical protein
MEHPEGGGHRTVFAVMLAVSIVSGAVVVLAPGAARAAMCPSAISSCARPS